MIRFNEKWRIRNVAQAPETTRTAPSGGEVGPEVVAAVVAALRAISSGSCVTDWADQPHQQMQDVADRALALLPEPVDRDLLIARQIASDVTEHDQDFARAIRDGREDDCSEVRAALAAIKRGRVLAAGGRHE